jgi:DNA-binding beta-propeller fold protein YncE
VFDRFRGAAVALTAAILVGAASVPTDSLGATPTVSPLAGPQSLKTSGEPFGVAVDAQSGRAYVTDLKEDTLFVFDLVSGGALAYIPTGRQPNHVVLSGGRAFVSNFTDASITVIDTSANRALETLPVGGLGLTVNRETNRLYAAAGSRLSVLDTTTGAVIATIPAPAGANLWGVAVDPLANRIYATDIANPRVLVYEGKSNALVAEIAIDAPARFGIAVGAAGRVFVASYTDQSPQLTVIDGPSAKVVARRPIAPFTASLVVDAASTVVYGSSGVDRSITAVNVVLGGAPSRVSLDQVPGGLAINPVTSELIVVTPGGAPPPARLPGLVPVTKP